LNEKTGRAPLLVYPEGATTNNEQIIQWKNGSFRGLNSIQPLGLKYRSMNGISPQNDTNSALNHLYICTLSSCMTLHMKIYPVFKPNDYFWKTHYDEASGLTKWDFYLKILREEIMAKSFGFELSDTTMADKADYKTLLKGKKLKEKKED